MILMMMSQKFHSSIQFLKSFFFCQLDQRNVTVFIFLFHQLKVSTVTIKKNISIDLKCELFTNFLLDFFSSLLYLTL